MINCVSVIMNIINLKGGGFWGLHVKTSPAATGLLYSALPVVGHWCTSFPFSSRVGHIQSVVVMVVDGHVQVSSLDYRHDV